MQNAEVQGESQLSTSKHPSPSKRSLTKADAFLLFCASREKGRTIAESSRLALVSANTATQWERRRRLKEENGLDGARTRIASKSELCETLTDLQRDKAVPPPYRVQAGTALAKVMGYEAPTRTESLIVHVSVDQWLEAKERAELSGGQQSQLSAPAAEK